MSDELSSLSGNNKPLSAEELDELHNLWLDYRDDYPEEFPRLIAQAWRARRWHEAYSDERADLEDLRVQYRELQAQNARLRGALEMIANNMAPAENIGEVSRNLARAALGEEE